LESDNVEQWDESLSSRKLGKYGHSKGWRRERLRTASGLTIDALGLDTGTRGAKIENQRPDFIIFDDVDEKFDTPKNDTEENRDHNSINPSGWIFQLCGHVHSEPDPRKQHSITISRRPR